jgi:hypothetical protein
MAILSALRLVVAAVFIVVTTAFVRIFYSEFGHVLIMRDSFAFFTSSRGRLLSVQDVHPNLFRPSSRTSW